MAVDDLAAWARRWLERFWPLASLRREGLSAVEADLLRYLLYHHVVRGHPPTLREAALALGCALRHAHGRAAGLERQGWLARAPTASRSLVPVGLAWVPVPVRFLPLLEEAFRVLGCDPPGVPTAGLAGGVPGGGAGDANLPPGSPGGDPGGHGRGVTAPGPAADGAAGLAVDRPGAAAVGQD